MYYVYVAWKYFFLHYMYLPADTTEMFDFGVVFYASIVDVFYVFNYFCVFGSVMLPYALYKGKKRQIQQN